MHVIRLQVIESPGMCDKIVLYAFHSSFMDVQTNADQNFDRQELIYYLLNLFIYAIILLCYISLQNSF